jgi:hypothetical protein
MIEVCEVFSKITITTWSGVGTPLAAWAAGLTALVSASAALAMTAAVRDVRMLMTCSL